MAEIEDDFLIDPEFIQSEETEDAAIEEEVSLKRQATESQESKKKRKRSKKEFIPKVPLPCDNPLDFVWNEYITYKKSLKLSGLELDAIKVWDDFERKTENIHKVLESFGKGQGLRFLFVCSGALRCIEVIKSLKSTHRALKLFARHMKADEQINQLASGKFNVGVGTPARINKIILEMGDKALENCLLVILDASFVDVKKQTVLSMDSCKADVFKLIEIINERNNKNEASQIKIALY